MTDEPQHLVALSVANRVKSDRAVLKRRIANREVSVGAVLLSNPVEAQRMTVHALLSCQRGWGPEKASRFLGTLRIGEARRVCDLTERQRNEIGLRLDAPFGLAA